MNKIIKILVIIPARKGSKGIKNKNFLKLGKYTLLEHSCLFSKKLSFVEKVVISSDSEIAEKTAKKYNLIFSRRPKNLALDNSLMIDVIKNEVEKNNSFTHVIILQPTCPFRQINHYNDAYKKFKKKRLILL